MKILFVISGEKTGLQSFKFELTKKSTPATDGATGFLPTEDDNEKELACTASLKSGSKSDKVLLTVQCKHCYKPNDYQLMFTFVDLLISGEYHNIWIPLRGTGTGTYIIFKKYHIELFHSLKALIIILTTVM